MKQREELKLETEKYLAVPLKRSVPFESQFRWSDGVIQLAAVKRRVSTTDPNADVENKRSLRNQNKPKIDERAERAKKRGHLDEDDDHQPRLHSRYIEESEVCMNV